MSKPTLADFINNPDKAERNGYYPDFMSCGSLMASIFCWNSFLYIKDLVIDLLRDDVISLPKNFIILVAISFFTTTFPFFFPFWWLICWLIRKRYFKNIKKVKAQSDVENQKHLDEFFSLTKKG